MLDLFLNQAVGMMSGDTNPDKPSVSTKVSTNEATLRKTMICLRCDEFCERFSDYTFFAHLIRTLSNIRKSPLLRGDQLLWSAAIIYMVFKRENLIRRGTGGSQPGEEIALYFDIKLSSMRSKASVMMKYLTTTDTWLCKNEQED